MDYEKIYNVIISRAQLRASSKKEANSILGYSETHHIIPRCMNGTNDKSNLVHLSAREHFIAHQLLVKLHPNEAKLKYALKMMTVQKKSNSHRMTNRLYSWIREAFASTKRGKTKETDEGIKRGAEKRTGRTKETHPTLNSSRKGKSKTDDLSIAAQSEKLSGRTKETHDGYDRISKFRSGKTKENCSFIASMAQKMSGRSKETHPGVASQASKIRGRTKENDVGVARMAETLSGRTKENHPGLATTSLKLQESMCKIPPHIRSEIVEKRNEGLLYREIKDWLLIEHQIDFALSSLPPLYNREMARKSG